MGRRPCLPDMRPIIGPFPGKPGLWLDFGHHHLGLTLGPITGRLLGGADDRRGAVRRPRAVQGGAVRSLTIREAAPGGVKAQPGREFRASKCK